MDCARNREARPRWREHHQRVVIGNVNHIWIDGKDLDIPFGRDDIDVAIRCQIAEGPGTLAHPLHGKLKIEGDMKIFWQNLRALSWMLARMRPN